jgi:hypothetical protein
LPQAREKIFERLADFLGSAQNKILIAMYWLTSDTPVLNLLGKAKERNVDIQIILDESTLTKFPDIITKLSMHNIIPLISLRPASIEGKMHNKFIVIDDTAVWTGSANFTPTVIKPNLQAYNDENILIINSPDLAKQYSDEFQRLEQSIIGFYMHHINFTPIRSLPDWFSSLCTKLFETNSTFREKIFKALSDPQNMQLQEKIYTIFPTLKIQQETAPASQEPAAAPQPDISQPTATQAILYQNLGYQVPTSRHTATEFIDKLSRELQESEEYSEDYSSGPTMSELQEEEESQFQDEPATPAAQRRRLTTEEETTPEQKAFLELIGYNPNVSREEADKIIKEILKD